ncbi:DNA-dependent RNA polymerase subunit epsilon [Alkalihalobacillus pseudalcaliphilus]|uniref:DNA-dependent RNA polymerase subunit epsilon n=1 Tax=Alkalihalobacillus pseudalcaliphilus TaxID=79884 RepID=UPI00064D76F9|nr:DNA-directed RNA polymerase subunit epsilon [Alkalihalobacillus pseudalcaliphilus]KMK77059.1 hypothetical protein AB990_05765 [Alkalihalobacillus pseudalcaliphilus]
MLFKVFYQKNARQVPVRELTDSIYVEAESISEVRSKLADRNYNIEFITSISGAHLEYEQSREDFKVESI